MSVDVMNMNKSININTSPGIH